ncbi:OB-fold nucleic acid binding domain-containing protein [Janibacter sp. GS2]|uniref:OB-fold nucleic acid binding domain-containing protein n=1 Tax=Janibacter sp. GS2 TaxID=3442646 RepID=UPI003EBD9914
MAALLRRLADFGRSDDDVAAGELREAATAQGCRPLAPGTDREIVTLAGTVAAVTLRPRATVPALVAQVYDGSMTVQLVWLGRRRITGIEPGAYVKVTGLICRPEGVPTIYNPAYELVPHHGR